MAWIAESPFFEPFCVLLRPVVEWLRTPANVAVAILILVVSPFIALLLLPLFLILIPAGIAIGIVAVIANSVKMESEEEGPKSIANHVIH